jgi:hypothetical protein
MTGPMIWTTANLQSVILQLPNQVLDAEDITMAEEAIQLQLKSWRRGMEAEIATRWPFPSATPDETANRG